ncbi:uncharacterized protein TrAtP1_010336 [Trichoderma atroviride]|uniref:Uncharacterized protein n=1 Tax=Hypocrea atroviridis (strain ATCC 20476 / IMI 206040) TaxID=452589 RepID=G9NR62_HYPAI|nr:uncharacterized protein TRIATDRAFT_306761 [Trichoderma atroviride IMI 206040]EHK47031.1 hypothetical protein TRIATDRAFT_306761 [Trichoderma atroviride IMI 206040]UKZ69325.1 hypothetical protein TrAtP1_010336 [Trichoderma atroviride]
MKVLFALAALFAAVTAMPQNCNFECSNGECCFEESACGTPGCNERRRFWTGEPEVTYSKPQ